MGIIKYPLDVNSKLFNNVRAVPSNFINRLPLLAHLVAYYKLDGNSNDSVGSNNGTDTAITYGTSYGKINQGALFNGTTSQITSASASLGIAGNISVGFWANVNTLPTSGNLMSMVAKYVGGAGASGYDVRLYNNGGTQELDFVVTTASQVSVVATKIITLSTSTWYYIVCTNDGTTSTIYLNGSSVATASSGNPDAATQNFYIGAINYNAGLMRFFNGAIDEVGIWSRALTSTEVSQLYNGGAGIQYPFY